VLSRSSIDAMGSKRARAQRNPTSNGIALPRGLGVGLAAVSVVVVALLLARHSLGTAHGGELHLVADAMQHSKCSRKDYRPAVKGCTPSQDSCGRVVVDGLVSAEEVGDLAALAARGMKMTSGGSGGPTILDLQSGALSMEDKFIDVWFAFNTTGQKAFTKSDVKVYHVVVNRIARELERRFGTSGLQLTAPTFFSRISADRPPVIPNDEYWHSHVDTLQYGSFHFTSLLYLSDSGEDFEGGRLVFDPSSGSTETERPAEYVTPKRGRVVLFSSGSEHPHHVERVTSGTRLALTIAFTCRAEQAIANFLDRALEDAGEAA